MNRRQVLVAGGTVVFGGVAGCLDDGSSGNRDDGYGPTPESTPEERSIDTSTYETQVFEGFEGIEVPLAPIDDVFYWYQRQEARIADARGSSQYEKSHIVGAVLSTAPPYVPENDPIDGWPESERIVTYCGCPHHLSGLRAAKLIEDGYEEVYAIDEGFWEWVERGYPIEGSDVDEDSQSYDVRGVTDPAYAGQLVWLEQLGAKRYEAAPIGDDGSYVVTLHYGGAPDSRFRLDAPDYTVEASLADLTKDVVTG